MKTNRNLIIIVILLAVAIYVALPNNPGIHALGIEKEIKTFLGLDLVGGVQVLLEADVPADTAVTVEQMNTARKIVENRVNGLGVTEALVQQAGTKRVLVELPGIADPEQAIATIKTTGQLEFVDMASITQEEAISLVGEKITTDIPSSAPSEAITATQVTTQTNPLLLNTWHTVMTGDKLSQVNVVSTQAGNYEVSFQLNSEGTTIFGDHTSKNVGKVLAIVLDKEVISVPTINSAITSGQGVIQGKFTAEEANQLAVQLRYGSLPVPFRIADVTTVGPTLGQDSLNKSLLAGSLGLGFVIVFMAVFYRLPGLIADAALICYALFAFALFRLIPVTLTLPGIAGFVLSVGMAVDANILIFERMKEELREGRNLITSIDLGWNRAWPSIRDSNLSTLITCAVLYVFGSAFGASIVKGFSLTLALGVAVSLFTAIFVSRTFLHFILDSINVADVRRWFNVELD